MKRLIDDMSAEDTQPIGTKPTTPIRALILKLTLAHQYGAGDKILEEMLADYLKESAQNNLVSP